MRIDCSVSLIERARFTYPSNPPRDYTAADLAMILARNRFEGAIVVGQLDNPAETDWLMELAGQHPWIVGILTRVSERTHWDRWQTNKKFLGVESPPLDDARELAERRLVCALPPAQGLAALESAPELRLAVRTMAGLSFAETEYDGWAKSLELLRSTTALMQIDGLLNLAGQDGWDAATYRPWVRSIIETFGAGRVAFGSGWPLSMPRYIWKESLACFTQAMGARGMEEREMILGENAARFYSGCNRS